MSDDEEDLVDFNIPLGHAPILFALPQNHSVAVGTSSYLGHKKGEYSTWTKPNGEIGIKLEGKVTNNDVFVLCARDDTQTETNFQIMQLLLLLDAINGEAPHRICVILPCVEYARQDRRIDHGDPIPPKLFLKLMQVAGASRFLTVDCHSQAEAAFCPLGAILDELTTCKYLAAFVRRNVPEFDETRALVCATTGGGMLFTKRMATELRAGFIMLDAARPTASGYMENRIIHDSGRKEVNAVIVADDMFDTLNKLSEVCRVVRGTYPEAKIYGVAVHGYFSKDAHINIQRNVNNGDLEWVGVTNSIAQEGARNRFDSVGMADRLKVVDISRLLAGAIARVHLNKSVNTKSFREVGPDSLDQELDDVVGDSDTESSD